MTQLYHKLEKLINHCLKTANVQPSQEFAKMISEDFKNGPSQPLEAIIIKWARFLKDKLDQGETLMKLINYFLKTDRQQGVWRLIEVTRFRNHVLAARARAEDNFEDRGTMQTWFKQDVKELQLRRLSYSIFETCLEVYPRVYIVDNNLECEDPMWREIGLVLLQYPPSDVPSMK